MLMLYSHSLLSRQKDSLTRTSLLHQVYLTVLSFGNGVDTEQDLSVSEA